MPSMSPYYQNGVAVPLFAGVQDTDAIFLRAMDNMEAENLLEVRNPLYQWLKATNRITKVGEVEPYDEIPLLAVENSTVQWYQGYDDAINQPQDSTRSAKYIWGQLSGTQMYNRDEVLKTRGSETVLSKLVDDKTTQIVTTMSNRFATAMMGTQDADGRMMLGLGRVMTANVSCGGISPTDPNFAYWNPQVVLASGGGNYSLATQLMQGLRALEIACAVDGYSVPDCFVCGADVYEAVQAYYDSKTTFQPGQGDKRHDASSVSGGQKSKGLWFTTASGKTFIYEPSLGAKVVWALNWDFLKLEIHSGTDFTFTPWQMMEGKVAAKKRNCLLAVKLACKRRNYQGTLTFS